MVLEAVVFLQVHIVDYDNFYAVYSPTFQKVVWRIPTVAAPIFLNH